MLYRMFCYRYFRLQNGHYFLISGKDLCSIPYINLAKGASEINRGGVIKLFQIQNVNTSQQNGGAKATIFAPLLPILHFD